MLVSPIVINKLAFVLKFILLSFKSYPYIHEIQNLNFLELWTESSEIKASSGEDAKYFPGGGSGLYNANDFQGYKTSKIKYF